MATQARRVTSINVFAVSVSAVSGCRGWKHSFGYGQRISVGLQQVVQTCCRRVVVVALLPTSGRSNVHPLTDHDQPP